MVNCPILSVKIKQTPRVKIFNNKLLSNDTVSLDEALPQAYVYSCKSIRNLLKKIDLEVVYISAYAEKNHTFKNYIRKLSTLLSHKLIDHIGCTFILKNS